VYQDWNEVNLLGALLSMEIDCTIRLANNNSKSFKCKHGVLFTQQDVQYAASSKDWSKITKMHNEGSKRHA
jgi:hypothetical protein